MDKKILNSSNVGIYMVELSSTLHSNIGQQSTVKYKSGTMGPSNDGLIDPFFQRKLFESIKFWFSLSF